VHSNSISHTDTERERERRSEVRTKSSSSSPLTYSSSNFLLEFFDSKDAKLFLDTRRGSRSRRRRSGQWLDVEHRITSSGKVWNLLEKLFILCRARSRSVRTHSHHQQQPRVCVCRVMCWLDGCEVTHQRAEWNAIRRCQVPAYRKLVGIVRKIETQFVRANWNKLIDHDLEAPDAVVVLDTQ
jgi:hypothetical protein